MSKEQVQNELFDDCNTGIKPYEILLQVLGDRKLPFLSEFDSCHTHPIITLPIGYSIELDATNKSICIISV